MKTVIITGGTKGIGAEIAKKFMDANYKVIIGARKKAGLALESHRNLRRDRARSYCQTVSNFWNPSAKTIAFPN